MRVEILQKLDWSICTIMMKINRFSSGKNIIIRTNPVKFQRVIITFTMLFTPVIFVKNISSMQKFIEYVEGFFKLQVTSRSV